MVTGTGRNLLILLKEDQEVIPVLRSRLQITHPAQERLATLPGSTSLIFSKSGVASCKSHKSQISESAVRLGLQFFVLIRED